MWPSEWPAPARAIATTVDAAVTAARATDAPAFHATLGDLAELPADQVRAVLGAAVREQLEIAHPDGLTADDIRAVLAAVVGAALPWLPDLDATAVVTVLTGALGVTEADDDRDQPPADPQPAAVLLIAHLAELSQVPATDSIRRAIGEIARAETVEMP
ncbi:hypothetical protein [Nocardia rhizosphaerae]|uniref:Uncharacterized protein n=1 Tax=Nocardia rhizosphaerae TaxID=1691571 RepID=A0ABV8LD37_9NOCA